MTERKDFARSLQAYRDIDAAMTLWSDNVRTDMPRHTYEAGWDAMGCAHAKAIDTVGTTPATTLADIAAKADFIATLPDYRDVIDEWAHQSIRSLAADIAAMIDRPMQDAFAVKLRAYQRTLEDREAFDKANTPNADAPEGAWAAFEDAMGHLHSAVREAAEAVVMEPAPDAAALAEKRRIFAAEEMRHIGEDVGDFVEVIFADGLRLAGGAA